MGNETKDIVTILVKHNKQALIEIINQVGFKALEKVVADSPNKIDDIFLSQFGEAMKIEIAKLIEKL